MRRSGLKTPAHLQLSQSTLMVESLLVLPQNLSRNQKSLTGMKLGSQFLSSDAWFLFEYQKIYGFIFNNSPSLFYCIFHIFLNLALWLKFVILAAY